MSCNNNIEIKELPAFPSHRSKTFPFMIEDGASFSQEPKCVITDRIGGIAIKELTVGDGIVINGQTATITIDGTQLKKHAGECLHVYTYLVDSDNTVVLKFYLEKSYK